MLNSGENVVDESVGADVHQDEAGRSVDIQEIVEEEIMVSSVKNSVRLENFLEELRIISFFLPQRDAVEEFDIL